MSNEPFTVKLPRRLYKNNLFLPKNVSNYFCQCKHRCISVEFVLFCFASSGSIYDFAVSFILRCTHQSSCYLWHGCDRCNFSATCCYVHHCPLWRWDRWCSSTLWVSYWYLKFPKYYDQSQYSLKLCGKSNVVNKFE